MSRILIVDDDAIYRNVLSRILKNAGYEVALAAGSQEALDLLKESPYDVLLTDIIMPTISGIELLRRVREMSPRIQVILMTGEPNIETASAAIRAGAFDYQIKPTTNEGILRCVGNAVKLKMTDDERSRLAEANREYQKNLEQLVQDRTALLQQKSTQLSLSIQAANIGLWDWDLRTDQIYFSPEWKSQIGYRDEDFPNCQKAWQSRLHPNDRERVLTTLSDACKNSQPVCVIEFRLRHNDGSYRWLLARGEVLRDENQTPCRMLGCQIDITQQKRAEERLLAFSRRILTVREDERRSIAAALHHDVGSLAVGLSARLAAVKSALLEGKTDEVLLELEHAQDVFSQSVKVLKRLALNLHPTDLDLLGLPAALRQHFDQLAHSSGTLIRFYDNTHNYRFPAEEAIMLFRIAQESVTNALKHAQAKRVDVRISSNDACSHLTIRDDGIGFDVEQVLADPGSHLGLRSMREMAGSLGADWQIRSAPGQDTTVTVVLHKKKKEVIS